MSLVLGTRKMSMGPALTLGISTRSDLLHQPSPARAPRQVEEEGAGDHRDESSEISSIGFPGESDNSEEEGEVQSKRNGIFGSLQSLEDSLPIKRGLSNHYMGKAKSFGDLSLAVTSVDMVKPENTFNKRRRTQIAHRWLIRMKKSPSTSSLYMSHLKEEPYAEVATASARRRVEEEDGDRGDRVENKRSNVPS